MSPYALDGVPDIKSDLGLQEPLCFSEIIAFLPFSASFHFYTMYKKVFKVNTTEKKILLTELML